jgi:hypothetical protein
MYTADKNAEAKGAASELKLDKATEIRITGLERRLTALLSKSYPTEEELAQITKIQQELANFYAQGSGAGASQSPAEWTWDSETRTFR